MRGLLCSTGLGIWFFDEEANLTEDVRIYKNANAAEKHPRSRNATPRQELTKKRPRCSG